jgi:hypothetical protein
MVLSYTAWLPLWSAVEQPRQAASAAHDQPSRSGESGTPAGVRDVRQPRLPMTSRRAIQGSGSVDLARSTLAKRTLPGSPFRRLAKSCPDHLIRFRLRKWLPCDPLDSSQDKSPPGNALAVCAPCPHRNETLQQVNLKTAVEANTARLASGPDTRCGVSFS